MTKHKRGFTSRRHPELDSGSSRIFNKGFTLLEVLVVVIIIAVLAAIAVPQYKHAVLKSRFSAVMPMAKSVADANEVYYLGKNMYALGQDDLDVTPVSAENTSVKLSGEYQNANEDYEYVAAWRTDVPGVRYIQYQKNSPKFASNIHCEADETNEEALWLCEKGLNGTEIPGSINMAAGDYKTFLLAGNIGTDKLPTSLNKLAASLCAGKEGCTYTLNDTDEDGTADTITTKECGTRVTYPTSATSSMGGQGCVSFTYDEEENIIGSKFLKCDSRYSTLTSTGECKVTSAGQYEIIYEDGVAVASKSCVYYDESRGGCWRVSAANQKNHTASYRDCAAGSAITTPGNGLTCAAGYAQAYDTINITNGNKQENSNLYCDLNKMASDGTCQKYTSGAQTTYITDDNNRRTDLTGTCVKWNTNMTACTQWGTYVANGHYYDPDTGNYVGTTQISCSSYGQVTETGCRGTWKQSGAGGTMTCPLGSGYDAVDWEHGVCKTAS